MPSHVCLVLENQIGCTCHALINKIRIRLRLFNLERRASLFNELKTNSKNGEMKKMILRMALLKQMKTT